MNILQKKKLSIQDFKRNSFSCPIVGLTAYTTNMAKMIDSHVDFILVGDSLGMIVYGLTNTQSVDLSMMINHGKAVVKGAKKSPVFIDLPFGTYKESPEQAYKTASRVIKETGCDAIKIEGGKEMAPTINFLKTRGIEVMGHIGFSPQSVNNFNNVVIKGYSEKEKKSLINDALELEKSGAFAIVIEAVAETAASAVTSKLSIPSIGIGASPNCDGQILVTDDVLGMTYSLNKNKKLKKPRFVKEYIQFTKNFNEDAIKDFSKDVRLKRFPTNDYCYMSNSTNIKHLKFKKN